MYWELSELKGLMGGWCSDYFLRLTAGQNTNSKINLK